MAATPKLNRDYERRPYWHATMPKLSGSERARPPGRHRRRRGRRGLHRVSRRRASWPRAARRSSCSSRGPLGWGASTRNGGIAHPGYKWGPDSMIKRYGRDLASRAVRGLGRGDGLPRPDRSATTASMPSCGSTATSSSPGRSATPRTSRARSRRETALGNAGPGRAVRPARRGDRDDRLPRRPRARHRRRPASREMVRRARRARGAAGADLHEGVRATSIRRQGDGRFVVETERGAIHARDVLVATNAYTDGAAPSLRRRIIPIGVVHHRDRAAAGGPGPRAVADRPGVLRHQQLPGLLARERGPPPDLGRPGQLPPDDRRPDREAAPQADARGPPAGRRLPGRVLVGRQDRDDVRSDAAHRPHAAA